MGEVGEVGEEVGEVGEVGWGGVVGGAGGVVGVVVGGVGVGGEVGGGGGGGGREVGRMREVRGGVLVRGWMRMKMRQGPNPRTRRAAAHTSRVLASQPKLLQRPSH